MTSPPKEAVLSPGQVVGKCEVVRLLGKGGMGQVYLATHQGLKKPVALKVLSLKSLDASQVERFIKEAQLASRIEHPNVVTILDVDYARAIGLHYIIMQYVRGKNLAELVDEEGGPLPWRRALEIIKAAAEGLAAVHRQKLIHRDIKHTNIMLTDDGRVLLMDFGLAREEASSELTRSGGVLGTPAFMAPEQGRSERLDRSSDIFSLGGTLYYLLTGRAPFQGGSVSEVMRRVVVGMMPPPARQVNSFVPQAVSDLVEKAMGPLRGQCFADAETFAAEIGKLLTRVPPPPTDGRDTTDRSSLETSGEPILRPLGPATAPTVPAHDRHKPGGHRTVPPRPPAPDRPGLLRTVGPWAAGAAAIAVCLVLLALQLSKGPAKEAGGKPKGSEGQAGGDDKKAPRVDPPGMVWVPEGDVQVGNDEKSLRAYASSVPALRDKLEDFDRFVRLIYEEGTSKKRVPGFWIDKYEVTNADYARFVQATGHRAPQHWVGKAPAPGLDNHPVVNVNHADALAYAAWAKKKLPTEEQWVRAYRGDKDWMLPWGNEWFPGRANVGENRAFPTTSPVNATPEDVSLLGVCNLVGNVAELMRDLVSKDGKSWVLGHGAHFDNRGHVYGVASFRVRYRDDTEVNNATGFRCVVEGP